MLVNPSGRDKALPATRANGGIEADYRQRLQRLVDEMHRSLVYWLSAAYRANPPVALAQDTTPAQAMRKAMQTLRKRWEHKFDTMADELAQYFADKSLQHADNALRQILKRGGFAVKFTMTPAARDAYQAVIGENVGLIRSIPRKHLDEVEGLVMRSVQRGRDLKMLTDELTERYDITRKRAAFIARDQNNKATSVMSVARQTGLGIKKGIWQHSHGGKHPRESHVEADGKEFDLESGMLIDGEYIWPGELPNCRCTWRPVIPGFED